MKIKLFKDWKMVSEGLLLLSIMIYLIFALRLDLLTFVIWPIFFGAYYILIQMINRYKRLKAKLNASYMQFLDSRIYKELSSMEDILFSIISTHSIGKDCKNYITPMVINNSAIEITSDSLKSLTKNAQGRYVEILELFEEKSIKDPKTNIEYDFTWMITISKIGFPYTKPRMQSICFDGYFVQGETTKCLLIFCEFIEVLTVGGDTIKIPVFFLDEHYLHILNEHSKLKNMVTINKAAITMKVVDKQKRQ